MAKVRIVVDTNVYVSGLLWTGLPHDLLSAAETGHLTLVTTPAIIEEVREVLARPKFAARMRTLTTSVDELMESFLGIVQIIQEPKVVRVVRSDPTMTSSSRALAYFGRYSSAKHETIQEHSHCHATAVLDGVENTVAEQEHTILSIQIKGGCHEV